MPNFDATVVLSGKAKQVRIVAANRDEAMRQLRRQGRVTKIRRESIFDSAPVLNSTERYIFLIKLSTMVTARVPMSHALELMAENFTGNIRKVAASISDKVKSGMEFMQAIEAEGRSFPQSTIEMIRTGFSAGNTSKALREAAEFENLIRTIQKGSMKDIQMGFAYMLASAALTWGTIVYFGPMVTNNTMFSQQGVSTEWIENAGWIFLYINLFIVFALAGLAFFATFGRLVKPAAADRIIAKIPYYSDLVLAKNNYLLFYKMALLMKSGLRIENCLDLVSRDAPRGALKEDFIRCLQFVRSGKKWQDGLESLEPTDVAALKASQDSTDIARTFDAMADQSRDIFLQRVRTLGPVLNVLAALFMSIASAFMFGLTILPILQLSASF